MAVLDYSTKIKARKTVTEIMDLLADMDANEVTTSYDKVGEERVPREITFSADQYGEGGSKNPV